MASFVVKQVVGSKLNDMTGGLNKTLGGGGGDSDGGDGTGRTGDGEDPEVVAARKEQEERRKEKHRKMEVEREKMRSDIRNKYNLQKREDGGGSGGPGGNMADFNDMCRVGSARKKTPEELAQEMKAAEDDSIIGQLGLTEQVEKAKTAVNSAFETVRGFLPFGK